MDMHVAAQLQAHKQLSSWVPHQQTAKVSCLDLFCLKIYFAYSLLYTQNTSSKVPVQLLIDILQKQTQNHVILKGDFILNLVA